MNNISENINLSTVRTVVCEELSDIWASVAKIAETVTSEQSSTQARMSYLVNHPNDRGGTEVNISAEDQKLIRLQFHMYTRQCQRIMHEDGIVETNWKRLSSQQKLYYSLRLEELIFLYYQFALHRCRDQWAAALLLQEVMKAEPHTEKWQIEYITFSLMQDIALILFFIKKYAGKVERRSSKRRVKSKFCLYSQLLELVNEHT
ncbi:hypothetical protein PHYBLDRAFT_62400 [Phycomyces blakesleeanus NRRL 1555(-)]|uniref:Uncharacterized protein n=1 Tax=Phycomyces blakesleeanus (strain ATCC 8743b / DSM 1359 / FGSC 10004 / NBRC 33097 / NRRL 1555) TaxID=763407 RepID=A0A167PZW9_PHYB8|nr:hypothetical protein PHYBLDRAFT_62400 [Phycomyces blakesleeanus NRRL 1555(-)]OAD78839.1 hypothetical protein PHYBLDRAFT_62400 [Phycomyces blakesleeanus NRRL 1555(-)]|eukprot:XP_018296879.1 hypothetical protein PHYBLDRAFT_62400 [Phycomyces blakesleeanus NRRL 1555(-)]